MPSQPSISIFMPTPAKREQKENARERQVSKLKSSNNLLLPNPAQNASPESRIGETKAARRPPLPDIPAAISTPAEHVKLLWPGLEDGSTEHPWGIKTIRRRHAPAGKQEKAVRVLSPRPPTALRPGQRPKPQKGRPRHVVLSDFNALAGQDDIDISLSVFSVWRRLEYLRSLTCLVLDFDVLAPTDGAHVIHADTDAFLAVESAIQKTLACIEDQSIDTPNLVVRTGRGFHLYWLFSTIVPGAAHPRWRTTQEHLIKRMAALPYRPDASCSDATRVFRLVGTRNTKVLDEQSHTWIVTAEVLRRERHSFDTLADQINPLTRRQCSDLSAARKKRLANSVANAVAPVLRGPEHLRAQHARQIERAGKQYQWMEAQIQTLGGKIDRGARDTVLFAAGCCLAWMVPPEQLADHITQFAGAYLVGMNSREAVGQRMITVIQRAQSASRSEITTIYEDLRYVLSPDWFVKRLADVFGAAVAQVKSFGGRRPRATGEYTKTGVRATHLEAALRAHEERQSGATLAEIAAVVGVSIKTVHSWLNVPLEDIQSALQRAKPQEACPTPLVLPKPSLNGSCPPMNAGNLQKTTRGGSGGDSSLALAPVDNFQPAGKRVEIASFSGAKVSSVPGHAPVDMPLTEEGARQLPVIDALQRAGFICRPDGEHRPRSRDQARWHVSHPSEPWVYEVQVKADHAWYVAPSGDDEVLSGYGGLWAVRRLLKIGYHDALERVGCPRPEKLASRGRRQKKAR